MPTSIKRKLNKAIIYGTNWLKHRVDVIVLYFDWILFTKKMICKEISEHDLGNCTVIPYHIRKWHNGTSVFIAETKGGAKYFIKRSLNKKAILAETKLLSELVDISDFVDAKVCKLLMISSNQEFVVEEYVDAKPLSDKQYVSSISLDEKIIILNKLIELVNELQSRGIVHADFTPKNLLVSEGREIYLIDFEYSLIKKDENYNEPVNVITSNMNKLRSLGSEYSMRNGIFDDAYSLMTIAKYLVPDLISYDYNLWRRINLMIGKLQFNTNYGVFIDNQLKRDNK